MRSGTPPADAHQGIPRFAQVLEASIDLWPWLALAGGAGLLAEWLLYGRFRRARAPLLGAAGRPAVCAATAPALKASRRRR